MFLITSIYKRVFDEFDLVQEGYIVSFTSIEDFVSNSNDFVFNDIYFDILDTDTKCIISKLNFVQLLDYYDKGNLIGVLDFSGYIIVYTTNIHDYYFRNIGSIERFDSPTGKTSVAFFKEVTGCEDFNYSDKYKIVDGHKVYTILEPQDYKFFNQCGIDFYCKPLYTCNTALDLYKYLYNNLEITCESLVYLVLNDGIILKLNFTDKVLNFLIKLKVLKR